MGKKILTPYNMYPPPTLAAEKIVAWALDTESFPRGGRESFWSPSSWNKRNLPCIWRCIQDILRQSVKKSLCKLCCGNWRNQPWQYFKNFRWTYHPYWRYKAWNCRNSAIFTERIYRSPERVYPRHNEYRWPFNCNAWHGFKTTFWLHGDDACSRIAEKLRRNWPLWNAYGYKSANWVLLWPWAYNRSRIFYE